MENQVNDTRPIMLPLIDEATATAFKQGVEAEIEISRKRVRQEPKAGNPVRYTLPRWARRKDERRRRLVAAKNIRAAYDAGLIDSSGRSLLVEPLGERILPTTAEEWARVVTAPELPNEDMEDAVS